jgi:hypothetical protein
MAKRPVPTFRHADPEVVDYSVGEPRLSDVELRHGECLINAAAGAMRAGNPEVASRLIDEFDGTPRLVANTVTRTMRVGFESVAPAVELTRALTIDQIAKAFGVHRNTMRKILVEKGAVPFGSMYQMPVKNMPAEWRSKNGLR